MRALNRERGENGVVKMRFVKMRNGNNDVEPRPCKVHVDAAALGEMDADWLAELLVGFS